MSVKASSQVSMLDITDAYSVTLTSEAFAFVGNTSGAPSGLSCATQVIAYCGTQRCSKVTIGTVSCPSGISASISNNGSNAPTITFTTTATITAACEATIPVTVDGVTINKKFSFAVAKTGATGAQGPTGATGPTGNGVSSSTVDYQVSSSGTTIPTGTWQPSVPSVSPGQYLWTRTILKYTNGSSSSASYSVGRMGTNGTNGSNGRGIKSTVVTYQAGSSGTSAPTGIWTSSVPATSASAPYLWSKTVITYTDNNAPSTTYSVGSTPEGIVVGGRNLYLNSKNFFGGSFSGSISSTTFKGFGNDESVPSKQFALYSINALNGSDGGFYLFYNNTISNLNRLKKDETYTISFWIKSSVECRLSYTSIAESQTAISQYPSDWIVKTEWQKFEKTFKYTNNYVFTDCFYVTKICDLYISSPKLELGNKATDWTPAPEDLETRVTTAESSIKQTADKISLVVKSGDSESNMVLTDKVCELVANNINLKGRVTVLGNVTAGSFNIGSGKFVVSSGGELTATSATISGKISSSTISGGSININNQFKVDNGGNVEMSGTITIGKYTPSSPGITICGAVMASDANSAFYISHSNAIWLQPASHGNTTTRIYIDDDDIRLSSDRGGGSPSHGSFNITSSIMSFNCNGDGFNNSFSVTSSGITLSGATTIKATATTYALIPDANATYALGEGGSKGWSNIYIGNASSTYNGLRIINGTTNYNLCGIDSSNTMIFGDASWAPYIYVKNTSKPSSGAVQSFTIGDNGSTTINNAHVWLYGRNDTTSRYIGSYLVYARTYGSAANVVVTNNGVLGRSTSSSKRYKHDIREFSVDEVSCLYDLPLKKFKYNNDYISKDDEYYNKDLYGFIVEDLDEVLPISVQHNLDDDAEYTIPEMWNNNIIVPCLLKLIQDLNNRLKKVEEGKEN